MALTAEQKKFLMKIAEAEFQKMIKIEKETECFFRWDLIPDLNENQLYDAAQRASSFIENDDV